MHAAVVRSFDHPPRYEEFATPQPKGDQVLVDVLAAGLHPRVRSGANGTHYTSDGTLPMIPGVDAVGRLANGRRVYFVADDDAPGTMAEQALLDPRRAVPLPENADPATVAAAMNPAMSSWVALRRRISFQPGQSVLVLGATGNAGQMAVQIARHLGADQVVAAGRDPQRLELLPGLGATTVVPLGGDDPAQAAERLGKAAADVDVVIDYTWGRVTELAIPTVITHRAERSAPLDWIQIGSMAGPDLTLPSFVLRAANLRIMGSGQGSLTAAGIVAELPSLIEQLVAGTITADALPVPLSEVEQAWTAPAGPGRRIVFTPSV
ncbi:zinc-binding alcohol dehydrogenase family protein [Streptacidiphilus sp. PB12-B1b]|uniref:quinone oxidoreductase family protein n=1 Tax=Streptacidiphilus sp. PB12-B1b TaxID=2705012 RepID=UPI0015FA1041|nr:zinc-binding alcohol dehydrogenase family protein [Streptacidiphilus sp. PB12-B1b]QMU76661.1 zinc-binding alcohol dehydrogenase family protein [Streptacidiphilus sp. PB12-B1b]